MHTGSTGTLDIKRGLRTRYVLAMCQTTIHTKPQNQQILPQSELSVHSRLVGHRVAFPTSPPECHEVPEQGDGGRQSRVHQPQRRGRGTQRVLRKPKHDQMAQSRVNVEGEACSLSRRKGHATRTKGCCVFGASWHFTTRFDPPHTTFPPRQQAARSQF